FLTRRLIARRGEPLSTAWTRCTSQGFQGEAFLFLRQEQVAPFFTMAGSRCLAAGLGASRPSGSRSVTLAATSRRSVESSTTAHSVPTGAVIPRPVAGAHPRG